MAQKVLIVGEAPGADEETLGRPFVGASGCELVRMCQEAGFKSGKTYFEQKLGKYCADWSDSEFILTNVCAVRPPGNDISKFIAGTKKEVTSSHVKVRDRYVLPPIAEGFKSLAKLIDETRPTLILATGNVPMWALTGKWGITKWRGSQLVTDPLVYCMVHGTADSDIEQYQVIPILHPASILREWKSRQATVQDLRRAKRWAYDRWTAPKYNFILRPSYENAIATLSRLSDRLGSGDPLRLSFDIETRAGHIACAGISWSAVDAICIPFMCTERAGGYWDEDREGEIVHRLAGLLTHPNARVIGQNILYDSQYTWKHWGFVPRVDQDTMISQHSIFSDLPKSLAFICSLYCDHYVYWKDEGKHWDPKMGEESLWHYNCLDCTYTYEAAYCLQATASKMGLESVHTDQQHMFWPVLKAMQLGTLVDQKRRNDLIFEVEDEVGKRMQYLQDVLGHELNPDSPDQMHKLFYQDFKLPVQINRKTGKPTLDEDALMKLAAREPLIRPLVAAIGDVRTLRKFLSNFLTRRLDPDGRWRCSINIGGSASGKSAPKTYRLSTSESAFDTGANMQNIPSEKSKSIGKAAARHAMVNVGDPYDLPNIRSIFIPDPGKVWVELDLQRADLFVVAYEADDTLLKKVMHSGADIHLANAYSLAGKPVPPIEELVESHPAYAGHRKPMKLAREFAKVWCHGTDYGGQPKTMAANTGRSIVECTRNQHIWFEAHPGILEWHNRVREQVTSRRFIANRLGYRWYIFDRIESIIPDAIAWIPQSTVSVVINRIWMNLFKRAPWIETLIQVHDALCMQVPFQRLREALPIIRDCAQIVVPYPDPLIIPHSLWASPHSWGCSCNSCKEFNHSYAIA